MHSATDAGVDNYSAEGATFRLHRQVVVHIMDGHNSVTVQVFRDAK
jgi:hypothetical protein